MTGWSWNLLDLEAGARETSSYLGLLFLLSRQLVFRWVGPARDIAFLSLYE